MNFITLFKSMIVFCGTDNISQNISRIQIECGEYYVEYCQSLLALTSIGRSCLIFKVN